MAGTTNNSRKTTTEKGKKTAGTKAAGTKSAKQTASKQTGIRTKKQKQEAYQPEEESFIRSEVLVIASFAVAVLLFLSNFHLCGIAGDYLRMVQLGIFGIIGFVAPILLFVGTCFAMSNQGNPIASLKLGAVIVGVLVLCGIAELLLGGGFKEGQQILDSFHRSSVNGAGGGLVGGLLVMGLGSMFGTVGAYIVLFVLLAICAVCITEKSLVAVVKKGGGKAYQYAKEDADRRRVLHEERKEERRRLREEQKVRGVNLGSTKLEAMPEYEEYDDEYGGDEYYDDYADAEKSGGRDQKETEVHPADVFTGNINLPPQYIEEEDDSVPFEPDRSGSTPSVSAPGSGSGESVSNLNLDAKQKSKPAAEKQTGQGAIPDSEVPGTVIPDYPEPSVGIDRGTLYVQKDMRTLEEMDIVDDYSVPWDSRDDRGMSNQASERSVDLASAEGLDDFRQEPENIYEDEFLNTSKLKNEDQFPDSIDMDAVNMKESPYDAKIPEEAAPAPERLENSFSIPEETKRVVTASGKIIENDTEALKKKLETRREEKKQEEQVSGDISVAQQIEEKQLVKKEYQFPPLSLLKRGSRVAGNYSEKEYRETAIKLQQTLRNFGVGVTVTNVSCGPSVTRYELHPEQGVKVSKIVGLADDIKLNLAAADIRIEAPIPGKSAVGIEVPNKENNVVYLRDLLESDEFKNHGSRLAFAVGKDIGGQVVVTDVAKMPHLLIAGATGSGKSVCINTLIMSLIYKSDPEDVKMIMIDPKVVELSVYNGIPHLLIPVVTDPKKASGALNWAVAEMMDRYKKFAQYNVRDLKGFNAKVEAIKDIEDENKPKKMPQIVIIVDELADLMMVSPGEVEDSICRLAQLARAAGIHLVIATQRPSVNVITGLIKANVPSRIAFSVSSGVDSRTIIDMNGAEKLLGKGDMLFYPAGFQKPQRVQGAFVSDQEVSRVVEFLTAQELSPEYNPDIENQISSPAAVSPAETKNGRDEYFAQAGKFIIEKEKGSIGMLQRMFKIGFNRAARIMDQLAEAGVVGEEEGTKPRKVLMTLEEFEAMLEQER